MVKSLVSFYVIAFSLTGKPTSEALNICCHVAEWQCWCQSEMLVLELGTTIFSFSIWQHVFASVIYLLIHAYI